MLNYGTIDSRATLKSTTTVIEECEGSVSSRRADDGENAATISDNGISTGHLIAFYVSHGLFMWSNRCYEFSAVLFTASAFPNTLVEASIRALCAHLASFVFAPVLGRWLNHHSIKLWPVQGCVVVQRTSIALACVGWIMIMPDRQGNVGRDTSTAGSPKDASLIQFTALVFLGMLERLSAVGNLVIVEREWLPLLSTRHTSQGAQQEVRSNLHILNATTKRIDLATKLVAPLAVSRLAIHFDSLRATALILALLQPFSGGVELYLTRCVWHRCISMYGFNGQSSMATPAEQRCLSGEASGCSVEPSAAKQMLPWTSTAIASSGITIARAWYRTFASYLRHPAVLPSLAYVLEPLSVLTLAGSMTAYLLAAHFSLNEITLARSASTAMEIASTVITPLVISCFTSRPRTKTPNNLPLLMRVGIVGLSWQAICLLPVTGIFIAFPDLDGSDAETRPGTIVAILFGGLALSRLGPFAYSLVEQQIVQVEVGQSDRIAFSSVETALFDLAELARWCMLLLFSTPQTFRWAALFSFVTVVLSWSMVFRWVRTMSQNDE